MSTKKKKSSGKKSGGRVALIVIILVVLAVGLLLAGKYLWSEWQHQKALDALEQQQKEEQQAQEEAQAEQNAALDRAELYDGIYIDDISVGGKTVAEAREMVQAQINQKAQDIRLSVLVGESTTGFTGADLEITSDLEDILNQATQLGREGTIQERYDYVQQLPQNPVKFTTTVSYSAAPLEQKIRAIANVYHVDPVEPAITAFTPTEEEKFTYSEGKPGSMIDGDSLWLQVQEAVNSQRYGTVIADMVAVEPQSSVEDLKQYTQLITRFTSKMTKDSNRISNIKLACSSITGTILAPGQEFSYNTVVGKRTAEAGYKEAGVIISGMSDVGLGGGVCQVSGTLFNAAVRANCQITERNKHSYVLGYLDAGTDATVDYDSKKDLRFVNTAETPIYLYMYTENLNVIAEIYGAALPNGQTIDIKTEVLSRTKPGSEPVLTKDSRIPQGTTKEASGHTGVEVNVYKVTLDSDGDQISKELLHYDNYKVIQPKILCNPKDYASLLNPTPTPEPETTPAVEENPPEENLDE